MIDYQIDGHVQVVFIDRLPPYHKGEKATFTPERAAALIKAGRAERTPDQPLLDGAKSAARVTK